ncbi:MAG: ATP-binding cassette domain-containing protein [Ignavibacteriae bacterium]|nr:ATP-binding cassette domain-containing protein [Ignavibacteriota bacterium]
MTSTRHTIHIAAADRTLVSIKNFEIPENKITLLLGESGIGKSLMSKALFGLLDPDELSVRIDGEDSAKYLTRAEPRELQQNGFFVFQEPSTHLNPLLTLKSQLNEGSLSAAPNEAAILSELWSGAPADLAHLLEVYPKPYRPSGGEKQRMLLAMAFKKIDALIERGVATRELFVFDEPTGSLDNAYRDIFLAMLLDRFRRMKFTCLLITHDYSMIGKIFESHADVVSEMSFKEVVLKGEIVVQEEFDTGAYLKWLGGLRPSETVPQGRRLLHVESGAEVFGRRLILSRSRDGAPTPLELTNGELLYLKAASGTGKTTLVKLVMGLLRSERLTAQVGDAALSYATHRRFWQRHIWGKRMTMVFQHADEALNPESTVKGVLAALPSSRGQGEAYFMNLLRELFDVDERFLRKKVKHLSGGQKQRLNLLRGFALDTDVLILDEPLNGLDFESAGKVIAMLRRKQEAGKGILLISHNEEIFDNIVRPENVYHLRAEIIGH